jgi:hypothetical protein
MNPPEVPSCTLAKNLHTPPPFYDAIHWQYTTIRQFRPQIGLVVRNWVRFVNSSATYCKDSIFVPDARPGSPRDALAIAEKAARGIALNFRRPDD